MAETPLEWEAHEYTHSEKTTDWYWSVGLVAIVLAIIAILMNNVLFAILIIVGTVALLLLAIRKPRVITFTITKKGVVIDDLLYPYASLESFWVEDRFFEDKLLIKSKKALMPLITIPLGNMDSHEVQEVMLQHLPEEEQDQSLSHALMERLGF